MRQAGTVAYMSGADRNVEAGYPSVPRAAMLAVGEARAILAETEPDIRDGYERRTYHSYDSMTAALLAESLAAILPVLDEMEADANA